MFLGACGTSQEGGAGRDGDVVSVTQLGEELLTIEWVDDETIVGITDGDGAGNTFVWLVTQNGERLERLRLPDASGCQKTSFRTPSRLPDGRLGLVRECWGDVGDAFVENDLVAVQVEHASVEPLFPLSYDDALMLPRKDDASARSVAWGDNDGAVVSTGSSCGTLVDVGPGGATPLDVAVEAGERSWNLAAPLQVRAGGDCSRYGWASSVSTSAGADSYFFVGAPAAIGVTGPSRYELEVGMKYVRDRTHVEQGQ